MIFPALTRIYRWCRDRKRQVDKYTRWPPVGALELGDLRRLTPVSKKSGLDRGQPIDRYYIEKFLPSMPRISKAASWKSAILATPAGSVEIGSPSRMSCM